MSTQVRSFIYLIVGIYKTCREKVIECLANLACYLFSSTSLINSIKHEHSCKIHYLINCPLGGLLLPFIALRWENTIWAWREKSCLQGLQTTKAQTSCSLISAFVIRLLESIISRLSTCEISIFYLVSGAEQAGLNLTLSENQKTGSLDLWPIYF